MIMSARPNILIITADEYRSDCLGFAGHPDVTTPYLDSLAQKGIYFPNAYSSCPTCVPARAVFHTGLKPANTGRVGYRDGVDWNYSRTLGSEFTRLGYQTQVCGKMHVSPLRNRLGFEAVDLCDGYMHYWRKPDIPAYTEQGYADDYYHWLKNELGADADINANGLDCNSYISRPWHLDEKYHPTNWVTDRALDFLRRRDRRQPFLLNVSYVRPHAPYDAPRWYFDQYLSKNLAPPHKGDWNDPGLRDFGRTFNSSAAPADPTLIRQMQAGYYACISHLDHQIGRLIIRIIEEGLEDDTVIIFTSDHGDMLGDHGFVRKSLPYRGSAGIPMIISGPARIIGQSRTDARVAGLEDILPTCLWLCDESAEGLDGIDLLSPEKRDYLHGEHEFGWRDLSNQFIVTERDKYIWFSATGREQYFNLANDPYETREASAEYPERVSELREMLVSELTGREEGYVENGRLSPGKNKAKAVLSKLLK
jgi:arylsulfatase A-like enzyme